MVKIGMITLGHPDKAILGQLSYYDKTFGHYDKRTMCSHVFLYSGTLVSVLIYLSFPANTLLLARDIEFAPGCNVGELN